jgi:streptothricin acetyltransferase
MIEIKPYAQFNLAQFLSIYSGYTSYEKYAVDKTESDAGTQIKLKLVQLEHPYTRRWDTSAEDVQHYTRMIEQGYSLAAFEGSSMIGIGLATPVVWNKTFWVWEFHITESWRGKGVGRRLMEALAEKGKTAGMRTMLCETQNTNVPAIRFYRKMGFHIEGVDISYYTNQDYPDGEMALFMKKKL